MVRQAEGKSTRTIQSAAGRMHQTREEARYEIEGMRSELQAVRSAHAGAQGQIGNATARLQVSPGKGNWTAALNCPAMLCEYLQQLSAEGPSGLLQQPYAAMSPTVAGKRFIVRAFNSRAEAPTGGHDLETCLRSTSESADDEEPVEPQQYCHDKAATAQQQTSAASGGRGLQRCNRRPKRNRSPESSPERASPTPRRYAPSRVS